VSQPPEISVVVPTRDRSHFLREALLSVQAQDFAAFECIVVDDGSRDINATLGVVRDLHDDRFRLIQSRIGPSPGNGRSLQFAKGLAVNTGIEAATADWLAFLDDDDRYAPYRLSRGLASVHAQPNVRVTVARSAQFRAGPPRWPESSRVPPRLRRIRKPLARMMPHSSTWTLSRAAAYEVGLFRPYGTLEDWEFYSKLCAHAPIWYDDAVTAAIRLHDGTRDRYGLTDRVKMRRLLRKTGALSPDLASRAFQLYRLSQLESRAGQHARAVTHAVLALAPVPYPRYLVQTIRAVARALPLQTHFDLF
jgi:glycosyltransferase involved in cell wall biosynthesis